MLKRKHLSPWLLIYLIMSILHSVLTIGILIIIIVNDLSGFNIGTVSLTAFTSCKLSTIYKFYYFMKIILQVCFILSIFNIILSIVQFIFLLVHFIKYNSSSSDADQYENFPQLTKFKLNILYILNCMGLFCVVLIFGNLLMFFIQFGKCTLSVQDKSSIFLIPVLISGGVLLLQIILTCFLMKLTYHFNSSIKSQQQEEQLDYYNQSEIKRKILQLHSPNDLQLMRMSPYLKNSPSSTDQQNPKQLKSNLLNKNHNNYDTNGNNLNQSIYNTPNNINGNYQANQNYPINGNTSPNTISSQQKQILKKIPKYAYKAGKNNMNLNDIIFEQPNDQQGSQNYQNGKTQQQNNPDSKCSMINLKQFPPFPKSPYANSHYLKHLENKLITPHQRRKIKIPYLGIASGIIEFDSSNYISDLMLQEQNLQSLGRKKSGPNNMISSNGSMMGSPNQMVLNSTSRISGEPNLQNQNQINLTNSPQSQMKRRKYSELNNKSPNSPKRHTRNKSNSELNLSSYLKEKKAKQQKNKQDENPIHSYVQQDQNYENQINKIAQFEKLNKRRKKTTYSNYAEDGKQSQTKLYLHKNKHGQKGQHGRGNFQFEDQQSGYDPFYDQEFEDQIYTQRVLLNNKQDANKQHLNGSTLDLKSSSRLQSKKSIRQNDSSNSKNVKKGSKKDAMLLDYIRSKHQHQS